MLGLKRNMKKYIEEYHKLNTWEDMEYAISTFCVSSSILHTVSKLAKTVSFKDCLCKGQLVSKSWIINVGNEMKIFEGENISICGGWYGLLAAFIFSYADPNKISSIDIDPACADIANSINEYQYSKGKFEGITKNMIEAEYETCDTIINTSFEHLAFVNQWKSAISEYPGKIILVQSTNNLEPIDHINCCDNHVELLERMDFDEELYAGTMEFPHYKRFMVIGKYKDE